MTAKKTAANKTGAPKTATRSRGLRKIVVTGIGGRLGRLVAKRLHRLGTHEVVGIDRRRMGDLPKDIQHLQVDLRSKRAREVFRHGDVEALVHVGLMHNPRASQSEHHAWNILGTARLFEYCLEYRVPKVVVLSSADVYGARAENQQFLAENAPLLGAVDFPQIRDLIEVDMQATSFFWRAGAQQTETVVLRPVHILGSVRNAASNYLRLSRIPVLMGFDPMVQVIHELDVVEAIVEALQPGTYGVFNITGPGEVPLSVLLRETGKPVIPVPATVLKLGMSALWKLRLTSFPVPELACIQFVGMVDGTRAREVMKFRPRHGLREAVEAACQAE